MKELNNYELFHINGGKKESYFRKAGNYVGEFLGFTAAVVTSMFESMGPIKSIL